MLKHLKTLQHDSIIIQIIFRELAGSLLKSVNLKIFKNVKGQLWWWGSIMFGVCARTHTKRYAAASPQLAFYIFKNFKIQWLYQGTYELPEDDLNNDRNMLECF